MANRQAWELPEALLRYLPDSELAIALWDGAGSTLSLRVTKDIGPESGSLIFRGVSHVNMPPHVGSISGIEIGALADLPPNFLALSRPDVQRLNLDERVYLIHGSGGEEFFVIAEAVDYEIDQPVGAGQGSGAE